MFDPAEWQRRVAGEGCPACALQLTATGVLPPSLPNPKSKIENPKSSDPLWLTTLPSGLVRLQDDGSFPGYCILYYRRHVTELHELSPAERRQLMDDLARLAEAIAAVCRPAKLNYACLGNLVPHLHWHIVPRCPDDGWWGRPFTDRPEPQKRPLAPEEYARLREALRVPLRDALRAGP